MLLAGKKTALSIARELAFLLTAAGGEEDDRAWMSLELLLLAVLFSITVLALGWEAWQRRRGRNVPTCPHCGNRLKSVEPGRRQCEICHVYFRRLE
jgi:hypothetical protein